MAGKRQVPCCARCAKLCRMQQESIKGYIPDGLLKNLGIVIARSQGGKGRGGARTTKQSARLHLESAKRDCFVVPQLRDFSQ